MSLPLARRQLSLRRALFENAFRTATMIASSSPTPRSRAWWYVATKRAQRLRTRKELLVRSFATPVASRIVDGAAGREHYSKSATLPPLRACARARKPLRCETETAVPPFAVRGRPRLVTGDNPFQKNPAKIATPLMRRWADQAPWPTSDRHKECFKRWQPNRTGRSSEGSSHPATRAGSIVARDRTGVQNGEP
jgi:hypothetical protein